MKHLIGQTIKLEGRFRVTTRLSEREQSTIEMERTRLETLWTEARQNFGRLYDAYLTAEHQTKQSKPNPFFGASSQAVAKSVVEFTREHLGDRARYFEAIHHLDHAAEAGLMACQKICNTIFHSYGGEGSFDLIRTGETMRRVGATNTPEGKAGIDAARLANRPVRQLASLESAAWIVTQTIDRTTFYAAMACARRLHVLGSAQGKCLTPMQKKEIISTAFSPLLANLAQRNRAASETEVGTMASKK